MSEWDTRAIVIIVIEGAIILVGGLMLLSDVLS